MLGAGFFMKTTNMEGGLKACVFIVILVQVQIISGKPFFGFLFCDIFCDEDDPNITTTTTLEDLIDSLFDPCTDCPTRRPTTPRIPTPNPNMPPFNVFIPPNQNGMNISWFNNGPFNWMQYWPGGPVTPATPAPAQGQTAAPTTAAPATTAAAGNATTAAPTTAAG